MKTKNVLSLLVISLMLLQPAFAQQRQPDPVLLQKLKQMTAEQHLYPGGTYTYFDSVSRTGIQFSPKDFTINDVAAPIVKAPAPRTGNSILGGASNFHLVKDVNTSTDAGPYNYNTNATNYRQAYAVLNNVAYFTANDGIHGSELWRSDGTAEGTYLLKDIIAGSASASSYNIVTSGSLIFFTVYNYNLRTYQLWKSNGTTAGTVALASFDSQPTSLCNVEGTLFFTTTGNNYYNQLWKSDGTEAGTELVKDFLPDNVSYLHNLVSANGLLFFVAFSQTYGTELYRSDGSADGTYMVEDIYPSGDLYSGPSFLTAYNGKLYFTANDGSGNKLWVTDGVSGGATYANGYNNVLLNGYGSYYNIYGGYSFTVSNGILYFQGYTAATGWELYKYDAASQDGVVLVKDLTPGNGSSNFDVTNLVDVAGTLYFSIYSTTGSRLYKTNGTDAGTLLVKEFGAGQYAYNLSGANNKLYFNAVDAAHGYEPWVSDGTSAGTVLLADIYPGDISSYPNYFTACNGKVLFTAYSDVYGSELFASTGSGAQMVKEINSTTTSGSGPSYITPFKNDVFMSAYTFAKGQEIWKANDLDETMLMELYTGQGSSSPRGFTVKNNTLYFIASSFVSGVYSYGVYKSDGTADNTVLMAATTSSSYIYGFAVADNGNVFYVIYNYSNGKYELWKTDGTTDGTLLLQSGLYFNFGYFNTNGMQNVVTAVGNSVYFTATSLTINNGYELWTSDGTESGTVMVKDINPGTNSSTPLQLTAFNGSLFFAADDGSGNALWTSDGTEAGTLKLRNVNPQSFTISNNRLFFAGFTSTAGFELWKTDGTSEGTVLVKDIVAGADGSFPTNLTDVNGTLFFNAYDAQGIVQLMTSTGTAAGTQAVKALGTNNDGTYPVSFTQAANNLFFVLSGKLWASDGTPDGTGQVDDDVLNGLQVYNVVGNGSKLYLNGYTYQYGSELYAGDASQILLPVSLVSFGASLKGADVTATWQTSSEFNTAYFTVQRSTDAVHFTNVGSVAAKGSSTALQSYSYPDVNVANLVSAKTLYYRLQTVDKDGKTSLSKVVAVDMSAKGVLLVLRPNPAKDFVTLRLSNSSGNALIEVYDLSGKKMSTTHQQVQSGVDVRLNVSGMPSGVYVVKMTLNGRQFQQRFVKE